jgi:hypothetical protein
VTLAPPTSGGKWYAITENRQWSPTNTAVLQADDLAVATDGTVPAAPAVGAYQAAAALPNQPGTAGSTAGQRQVLAFVHVRAADTTLSIFDVRLVATKAGPLAATNLHGMRWASLVLQEGAMIGLLPFTAPGGSQHIQSAWIRSQSSMKILGLATVDSTGATTPFATDLLNAATAGGNYVAVFADQACVHDLKDKLDYAWTGTDDYSFRPIPSRRTKFAAILASARNVPLATWTDVEWDTILTDPSGMNVGTPNTNHYVKLPWKGWYRLMVTAALNNGDDAAQILRFQFLTPNGYQIAQSGSYGLVGDFPQQFTALYNQNLDQSDGNYPNYGYVRAQIFHNPNGGTRQFSSGSDVARAKVSVEYLGL